jgi:hypothetical protein
MDILVDRDPFAVGHEHDSYDEVDIYGDRTGRIIKVPNGRFGKWQTYEEDIAMQDLYIFRDSRICIPHTEVLPSGPGGVHVCRVARPEIKKESPRGPKPAALPPILMPKGQYVIVQDRIPGETMTLTDLDIPELREQFGVVLEEAIRIREQHKRCVDMLGSDCLKGILSSPPEARLGNFFIDRTNPAGGDFGTVTLCDTRMFFPGEYRARGNLLSGVNAWFFDELAAFQNQVVARELRKRGCDAVNGWQANFVPRVAAGVITPPAIALLRATGAYQRFEV